MNGEKVVIGGSQGAFLAVVGLGVRRLSFAVALIGIPLFVMLFGFFKIQGNTIPKDARNAGWAALVIALFACGYIFAFFVSWIIVTVRWYALHILMTIALVSSSTTADAY